MRTDKVAMWFTLGLGLMGIGAAAGVPIGLAMTTAIPEVMVAVIFAIIFVIGLYIVIAPIARWPLPAIGGITEEQERKEQERKEQERKEQERKEQERKEQERKEQEESRRAMIRALNEDATDRPDSRIE